jgi:O-antigen/teichoic acid export membrane protein
MSRLGRNILYNLAGQGTALLLGFVAVRFIYRELGADAVGIIFFALTLNAVISAVMDLGISSTIVREVAAGGSPSSISVQGLLRTAALFYWGSYALLATVLALLAGILVRKWLNVGVLDSSSAETSLRILGAGSLLALPRSLYSSLFKGLQRMGASNMIDTFSAAAQQAGIAVTIALGGTIVAVAWWIAFSNVAAVAAYILAAGRIVPARALVPGFDASSVQRNKAYASRMALVSALAMVHTNADKLIVSRLLPLGLFGLYGFGFNALNRGMLLTSAIAQAAFPSLSELHRSNDAEALLNQYKRLQNLVSYMTAAVFAVTPFAARPIFSLLFGPTQADQMLLPCTLLALGFYMNSTLTMPYILSLAMGKPGIALALNSWAVVAVLPATAILVWGWGLTGAALSWVIYHVFAYLYAAPRICRECIGGRVLSWYLDVAKFIVPAGAIFGIAWSGSVLITNGSLLGFTLAYVIGTIVYSAIGWTMLPADARDRVLKTTRAVGWKT